MAKRAFNILHDSRVKRVSVLRPTLTAQLMVVVAVVPSVGILRSWLAV